MDSYVQRKIQSYLPFISMLSLLVSSYGLYIIWRGNSYTIPESSSCPVSEIVGDVSKEGEIVAYISGAVLNPGLYKLENGRIADFIKAAGGVTAGVDFEYYTQSLNLAAVVSDGSHIYMPFRQQKYMTIAPISPEEISAVSNRTSDNSNATTTAININTASIDDLKSLKGIGDVYAGRIIDNRPYVSFDDLLSKSKVPAATLRGLVEYVVF